MLNLDRGVNQSVIIGDDIEVVVKQVFQRRDGSYVVKLGIDAPYDVPIDRDEVYNAKQRQKRSGKNKFSEKKGPIALNNLQAVEKHNEFDRRQFK